MTADGRLIKTDPVALGVWKRLVKQLSLMSLLLSSMFSARALLPFTADNLSMMAKTDRWKICLGLLGGLENEQVDFLVAYAEINSRRVDYVSRITTLLLVSAPVGVAIAINELDPTLWETAALDLLEAVIAIVAVWAVFAGLMMASAWRARDLYDLVAFEQARRQLDAAQNGMPVRGEDA